MISPCETSPRTLNFDCRGGILTGQFPVPRPSTARSTVCAAMVAALLAVSDADAQTPASQNVPPPPPRFETELVVTPERGETPRALVPASTDVLDREALAAIPAAHAGEISAFLPGFSAARAQFHAGRPVVSARGFFGGGEADYILLLVDGVPVSDVESGLVDWSLVPTSSIRRVEAFRGPGASLYGDAAVGGVVQILTDRVSGTRATMTAGSFATVTADASHGRQFDRANYHASVVARRTDGGFDHSGSRQLLGAGSVDRRRGSFSWRLNAAGDVRERDDPGSLSRDASAQAPYTSDPLFRFDTLDRHGFSTALALRHDAPSWRPQARIFVNTRDEDAIRTILLAPGFGDRRARAIESLSIGGRFDGEHAFAGARALARFGLDIARERLDTGYREVSPSGDIGALNSAAAGRRLRTGAFASTSWDAAPRVRAYGALRWDNVDDVGFAREEPADAARQRAWSPRAGVVTQLSARGAVSAYAQISRAFKAPTVDQRFDPRPYPDFMGGTFTISNRNLVPQRATNVEAGVSGSGRLRWSALAYRMDVRDEIDFDARTFSYANIGRSTHTGVELEVEGRWGERVRPSVAYALSRVVDAGTDLQLKNVPRHAITVSADVGLPWSVRGFARFHHSWGGFLDDDGAFSIDGPSTIDLRLRRHVGRHAIFFDALNAAGNKYEDYGFTLADFSGGSVPYVYPGAPRAVRAGLTLAF
jgi:outer membrane receptor protein involved in Fe transport